jgi:ABC-type dipeptide/oligopeptide/nickel transport system permease component
MSRSVLWTLAQLLFVLLGVSAVVFALTRLSGDPAVMLLPPEATEQEREAFRSAYGLNQPLHEQYLRFLQRALSGDLGKSIAFSEPALKLILRRFPATAELAFGAMMIVLLGIPAGIIGAFNRGTLVDRLVMLLAILGQSLATFWFGIMLILLFAVHWRLVPPSGRGSLAQLILPALTLAMYGTAVMARLTRSSMLEVLGEDYVRTARAKGISELMVICRHAFVNTLIPIVTVLGVQLGNLMAGAVVTEAVFAWPGLGSLTVEAIYRRDYPLVQAIILFFALMYVCINMLVELLYAYLDPRVRAS